MDSSSMEELSPGAHANKNLSPYQLLKLNMSPPLTPPEKPSGFAILLEKSSVLSWNPQHFIVTISQLSPSLLTAISHSHETNYWHMLPFHSLCHWRWIPQAYLLSYQWHDSWYPKAPLSPKAKHFAVAHGLQIRGGVLESNFMSELTLQLVPFLIILLVHLMCLPLLRS